MNKNHSIKHIWSVLCERSVVDTETNNISLYDILEELNVNVEYKGDNTQPLELVNVPFKYEVVSLWENTEDLAPIDAEVVIEFINPEGKTLKKIENKLESQKGIARLRSRLKIDGIAITGAGIYIFNIFLKNKGNNTFKLVANLPLTVKINTKKITL